MALTNQQVSHVCCISRGHKQCRYLEDEQDENGNIIYWCKKKVPQDKQYIDEMVFEFFEKMLISGQSPNKQGVPLGDNCKGYLPLKIIPQGYDVR